MRETDLGKYPPPASAYGFSKLIGEYYCRFFEEEFGLPYTICRPFNIYGLEDLPQAEVALSHVIPDLIKKITGGQYPVEILGNGNQTRCFTHVADVARGIILAMKSPKALNEDFNLGSNHETRILDLAELIFKICYPQKKFKYVLKGGFKMDVKRQTPVIDKARKILRWMPEKDLKLELPVIIDQIRQKTII
jgi:nucleoside-diphosphate-sugar epimerase